MEYALPVFAGSGNVKNITKTRPCNIQRFFKLIKMKIFS